MATTVINTGLDPQQQAAYQGVDERVNYLKSTETKKLDPTELQRRIGLANATAADAAAGQVAAGNARAAQLGRPELAGLFARKAADAAAARMSQQGQQMTAEELAKLDATNEARRDAVTNAMLQRESAARFGGQQALQQAGLAQTGIAADRAYALQQEQARQQAAQFNAQLAAQQAAQQAQLQAQREAQEFARQQAIAQMTLQNAQMGLTPGTTRTSNTSIKTGTGAFGAGSGGGGGLL